MTPTPIPTPWPWTNHPPSPLDQLTSGDLSARLGLVQRFYPHTPIILLEEGALDDCQAFPWEGCGGAREGWHVQVQYQDLVVTYWVSRDYQLRSIDAPQGLIDRQGLYLWGLWDEHGLWVHRYPDGTWHLFGEDYALSLQAHRQLDSQEVAELLSLAGTYSTIWHRKPDGDELRLYGLGRRAELNMEDRERLESLGHEFISLLW